MDPRGRRTRAALHDALLCLLRDRAISDVTVSELCRAAHIHRTTFYKHYGSVSEFVRSTFTEVDDLLAFDRAPLGGGNGYREMGARIFAVVLQRRGLYQRLLGPEGDLTFQRMLLDRFAARFSRTTGNRAADGDSLMNPELAGAVLAGITLAVVEALVSSEECEVGAAVETWAGCLPAWCTGGDG